MSKNKNKKPGFRNPIAVVMNKQYPVGRSFVIESKERGGNKNEQFELLQQYDDECEDDF